MSPRFHLAQDFTLGLEPRFNALGETAPERLPLIQAGALVKTLVSARSARKYGVPSNAAPEGRSCAPRWWAPATWTRRRS